MNKQTGLWFQAMKSLLEEALTADMVGEQLNEGWYAHAERIVAEITKASHVAD